MGNCAFVYSSYDDGAPRRQLSELAHGQAQQFAKVITYQRLTIALKFYKYNHSFTVLSIIMIILFQFLSVSRGPVASPRPATRTAIWTAATKFLSFLINQAFLKLFSTYYYNLTITSNYC